MIYHDYCILAHSFYILGSSMLHFKTFLVIIHIFVALRFQAAILLSSLLLLSGDLFSFPKLFSCSWHNAYLAYFLLYIQNTRASPYIHSFFLKSFVGLTLLHCCKASLSFLSNLCSQLKTSGDVICFFFWSATFCMAHVRFMSF